VDASLELPGSVSVVIPTWNGGARFRALLAELATQELSGGFELLVVDSGSRDGTLEAAREAGAATHSIPQSEFNHGATRNRAIAWSKGELVCLLTQDALPMGRDFLANLLAPFRDGNIDGVYARQFPRPDCDPILAERLRSWSAARDRPCVTFFEKRDPVESRRMFETLPPSQRYQACAFDNVASAVRRASWERHPFPERNFGEDVAWAREVLLEGGCIAFEPSARVEHSHRISIRREFKRIYRDHKNLCELFELVNVSSWKAVMQGWAHQRRYYRELLDGLGLGALTRLGWRLYSIPYALAETSAQFLGARSHWKARESAFWRAVDRRLSAD